MTPFVRLLVLSALVSCLRAQMQCMSADSDPVDVLTASAKGAAFYLSMIGEE